MYNSVSTINFQPKDSEEVWDNVRAYLAAGIAITPLHLDGSKRPKPSAWQKPMSKYQLSGYYAPASSAGVGIICGKASGGIEVIDFDWNALETYTDWASQLPELAAKLTTVRSPSPGIHVYYRCSEIASNTKLAMHSKEEVAIETRGEGGMIVACGGPVSVHNKRTPYECIRGSLLDIPEVTPAERELMHTVARGFNEYEGGDNAEARELKAWSGIDCALTWREILEPKGWVEIEANLWRRPGKDNEGGSASTKYGPLKVFSSNAHPFEGERAYAKVSAIALLYYGGNFDLASFALTDYSSLGDIEDRVNEIVGA